MDTLIPLSSGGQKQRFAETFDQQGLAIVSTAGSGATMNSLSLKAWG